ncbi:AEC family transporter [Pseudomonas aeruginosa]|uniref:AEC family transporter n=1 Tax=Pseudomonas aeruginosa TaxID=287 RepID=UPI00070C7758|nr:AEC family transporter [Pseudomonas aeruginosa]MDT8255255.1 AEC family transporter [Pseudomonas aeruginosa]
MTTLLLLALVPIALLICMGAWLRHSTFLQESFWPQAERLGYYVLLPSLFFHSLATAQLDEVPVRDMILALVLSTVLVAGLLVALRRAVSLDDPAFTSLFQGGVRFNNYVGVSIVAGLFGAQGIALAAVANAAIVPTVNVLCVLVFARYGSHGRLPFNAICRQLALNPLVVACVLGISVQASGFGIPVGIDAVLKALGQASLPLGLLCVGAALNLGAAGGWIKPIGLSSIIKFLIMPLATLGFCHVFGLKGEAAIAAILFQGLPTASSSYIMARQLGGDAPLMAGIIAGQTLLAGIVLPILVMSVTPWV